MIWKPDNCNCVCELEIINNETVGTVKQLCSYHKNFDQCLYDNRMKNIVLNNINDSITLNDEKYINYYYDVDNRLQFDSSGFTEIELNTIDSIITDYSNNNPYPVYIEYIAPDNSGIVEEFI